MYSNKDKFAPFTSESENTVKSVTEKCSFGDAKISSTKSKKPSNHYFEVKLEEGNVYAIALSYTLIETITLSFFLSF